jgi:hypothetical protein
LCWIETAEIGRLLISANNQYFFVFFYHTPRVTSQRMACNQEIQKNIDYWLRNRAAQLTFHVPAVSQNSRKLFGDSSIFLSQFSSKNNPFPKLKTEYTDFDRSYLLIIGSVCNLQSSNYSRLALSFPQSH